MVYYYYWPRNTKDGLLDTTVFALTRLPLPMHPKTSKTTLSHFYLVSKIERKLTGSGQTVVLKKGEEKAEKRTLLAINFIYSKIPLKDL